MGQQIGDDLPWQAEPVKEPAAEAASAEGPLDFDVEQRERDYLRTQLRLFNDAHVGQVARARGLEPDANPLDVVVRDALAHVRGGLLGYTHWGWLHVQTLWVDEQYRSQGHGRRIVDASEELARRRGCHHSRLGTYDFQARDFYQRLGYSTWGEVPDYPPGHTNYLMLKVLD